MRQGFHPTPAAILAVVALVAALAGSAYAGGRINGRTVKVKSLPGNRLKPRSVPGNRLKPRSIPANRLRPGVLRTAFSGQITGSQIDERSLGQVPSAGYADLAGTAQTATDAQTAVNAVNAVNAGTVNGHGAGCLAGTTPFAGACWQTSANEAAVMAPVAAAACAAQGGTLPEALQLAAFAQQPDVTLAEGDEWSGDITNVSGLDQYSVVTVSSTSGVNFSLATNTKRYRCVIPLVV